MRRAQALSSDTKGFGFVLASYGDPDGTRIWPGLPRLSRVTGDSERTCKRRIAELKRFKLLHEVSRGGGWGQHARASQYELRIPPDLGPLDLLDPYENGADEVWTTASTGATGGPSRVVDDRPADGQLGPPGTQLGPPEAPTGATGVTPPDHYQTRPDQRSPLRKLTRARDPGPVDDRRHRAASQRSLWPAPVEPDDASGSVSPAPESHEHRRGAGAGDRRLPADAFDQLRDQVLEHLVARGSSPAWRTVRSVMLDRCDRPGLDAAAAEPYEHVVASEGDHRSARARGRARGRSAG